MHPASCDLQTAGANGCAIRSTVRDAAQKWGSFSSRTFGLECFVRTEESKH